MNDSSDDSAKAAANDVSKSTGWQTPLWIVAGGVLIAGLYVGRLFLVPIAFAVLLNIVCRPIVRTLHRRLHLPAVLSAALIVLALVAVMVGAGIALSGPLARGWDAAPKSFEAAGERLRGLSGPIRQMTALKDRVDHLATTAPTSAPATGSHPAPEVPAPASPASDLPGIAISIFGGVTQFVGGVAEILLLAFLMLSSDGLFLRKLRDAIRDDEGKQNAVRVVHEAESLVLRFLVVGIALNCCLGIVVGLTMKLLGVPHPLLWAVLTLVLEFVPYLGATVMIFLLGVTALGSFDSLGHAALVPAAYLFISTISNSVVSPFLYGNRLRLNAVAILVGVIFFWFVWGVPGAFLAVPILSILRLASETSPRLKSFGSFLAD